MQDYLYVTGPPRIGDRVIYTRPALPNAGGPYAGLWLARRENPSLVIDVHHGEARCQLLDRDDDGRLTDRDPWRANVRDLRVVGRAVYTDLRLTTDDAAEALRGSVVALDFDGVLHSYRAGWTGYRPDDAPVENAVAFVRMLLDAGAKVVVHTARADSPRGVAEVRGWLERNGFPPLPISYEKVPAAAYVDDRAVPFDQDRGGFDDRVLADIIRQCRTRHSGEAYATARTGGVPHA